MKPTSVRNENRSLPTRLEIEQAVNELIGLHRARCFWSAPADYQPDTDEARLTALYQIEAHGNRQAFMRAREIREWLLQISNER